MQSYSQRLFTENLQWKNEYCDSVELLSFENKDRIIEWGKNQLPFSSIYSENIRIKNNNIFILRVIGCSGLPCLNIYIFKEKDKFWQLITSTQAVLKEQFVIEVDDCLERIIFRITLGKIIGELPFNIFNDD